MQLLIGVILGGFVSWLISRWYYKASGENLRRELAKQTRELNSPATLTTFEQKLSSSNWSKEYIGQVECWICESDQSYQLKIGGDDRPFKEPWTSFFPDPFTTMFHIHLQVNGVTIKSMPFISADRGRYTLPLPEQRVSGNDRFFTWSPDGIDYKIAEVIGSFYRESSLKGVARLLDIDIANVRHRN
ncbi:LapA family protein [Parahaliea sp. F7430]|uniref:LapA family protein n=1 Tax=Sediminihaliea albiluteola TaxID=2758564 RepID=A0A7W2TWS6_9GAMM|nr:LapA family protein [Sediminihaliea albiluteola]MBA6413401.1 LapA family protein [Sediminihaliea albiluteola]